MEPAFNPMQATMRGVSATMSPGRGSNIPTMMGAAATMPGIGPIAGILSALAMGGTRTMVPQIGAGIIGLVGSLFNSLNTQNRGNNPQFNRDNYMDNQVPAAMPPANIMQEIFGMQIGSVYRP